MPAVDFRELSMIELRVKGDPLLKFEQYRQKEAAQETFEYTLSNPILVLPAHPTISNEDRLIDYMMKTSGFFSNESRPAFRAKPIAYGSIGMAPYDNDTLVMTCPWGLGVYLTLTSEDELDVHILQWDRGVSLNQEGKSIFGRDKYRDRIKAFFEEG